MRKGKQGFLDYSSNIMFILQTSSENIINCALPEIDILITKQIS